MNKIKKELVRSLYLELDGNLYAVDIDELKVHPHYYNIGWNRIDIPYFTDYGVSVLTTEYHKSDIIDDYLVLTLTSDNELRIKIEFKEDLA